MLYRIVHAWDEKKKTWVDAVLIEILSNKYKIRILHSNEIEFTTRISKKLETTQFDKLLGMFGLLS